MIFGRTIRRSRLFGGAVLATAAAALAGATPALASAPCAAPSFSGHTATVTCPVGTSDTWTAPAGVTQATFNLQGGAGGYAINSASAPGDGGHTIATLTVTPGTVYYVAVGAVGSQGTTSGYAAGGAPGGGTSGPGVGCSPCTTDGGGGGGASVVATAPITSDTTTWLLAAGGGGGAGGSSGQPGGAGGGVTGGDGNYGGVGGNQTGSTGSGTHLAGSSATCDGGGGGGGYWGGSAPTCGGGAGGGSGYAPSAADFSTATDSGNGTVTITYTVTVPTVSITSPAANHVVPVGSSLVSSFSCSEGAGGSGVTTCVDQNGNPSGTALNTSVTGQHTVTVTATSSDGLTGQASVTYDVASAPTVTIALPANGATITQGQTVTSSFSCSDGAGGPGIASCVDSNGTAGSAGTLNTATTGTHIYTVTAISADGQTGSATVTYTVVAAPAPVLSGLSVGSTRLTVARGSSGGRVLTTVRYRDSLSAASTIRLLRCTGRGEKCGKLSSVKTIHHRDHAGLNRVRLTAGDFGRRVSTGPYVIEVTSATGKSGRKLTVKVTVGR
jgi:hypothetical protein